MQKKNVMKLMLFVTLGVGTILAGTLAMNDVNAASNPFTSSITKQKEDHAALLNQTKDLAKQGKVVTSEQFGVYSVKKEIEKKWGKADKNSPSGELRYSKHSTIFYFDDLDGAKDAVFLLQTTDKRYSNVSYDEVKKYLGKGGEYKGKDSGYVTYEIGDYKLTFYFPIIEGKFKNIKYVEVSSYS